MTMENAQFSEVNAKSSSQLSQQAEELLEVVHQFRLWEEAAEKESESSAASPEPGELEVMETATVNKTFLSSNTANRPGPLKILE